MQKKCIDMCQIISGGRDQDKYFYPYFYKYIPCIYPYFHDTNLYFALTFNIIG